MSSWIEEVDEDANVKEVKSANPFSSLLELLMVEL